MPAMVNNPMNGLDVRNPAKPGTKSFAITPDDANDLPTGTRKLYVGGAGAIKVSLVDDDANHTGTVLAAVPVGTMLELAVRRVYATGTAATNLVGFY
jgi:hypothetical protein